MDEEENKQVSEEEKQKGTVNTEGAGDKPKEPESIVKANLAAKRLEEATAKHKEQLDRQEDMIARQILGGTTEGGKEPVKPKEETDKEYRTRIDKELAKGKTEFGN